MALAERAKLVAELSLDDKMSGPLKRIDSKLGAFSGAVNRNLGRAVDSAASFAARKLTDAFTGGIEALKADAVVAASTAAVIKSTGGVAGITASQVNELADKLSILDGVQDDVVQNAENLLLTFTNIGKDIFPDATAAVLDMSAALGLDTAGAAKTLGKALQDPVKGMTALRKAGVILTDEQQKHIKNLIKQGDLYGAQKFLLAQVETKYKGVAEAQADADPSRRLQVATEKFQKSLAKGLLPVVEKVQTRLGEWLSKPETLATVQKIGDAIGGLFTDQNLDTIASGMEVAATAISKALTLFNSLPPEVKALAVGAFAINKVTGGAVTGIAGALTKIVGTGIGKIFATNVTVVGTNVTGGAGAAGGAAGAAGKAGKAGGLVRTATGLIGVGVAAEIAQQISGEVNQFGRDLHKKFLGGLPTISEESLQWPFGSKNTPKLLPEVFGGNGLLGGQGAATFERGKFKPVTPADTEKITKQVKTSNDVLGGIERTGNSTLTGAIGNSASRIAAAVANARVVPNVTTTVTVNVTPAGVQKATNTQVHYGKPNGSAGGGNSSAHGYQNGIQ